MSMVSNFCFAYLSLPVECQLYLLESCARESRKLRVNVLLLNKETYQRFAPVFYRSAIFTFDNPHSFFDHFVLAASETCIQNVCTLHWKYVYVDERNSNYEAFQVQAATTEYVERLKAFTYIYHRLSKLVNLCRFEVTFLTNDGERVEKDDDAFLPDGLEYVLDTRYSGQFTQSAKAILDVLKGWTIEWHVDYEDY